MTMEIELARFLHRSIHADRLGVLYPQASVFVAIDARFHAIDVVWSALPLLAKAKIQVSILLVAESHNEAESEIVNGALPIWKHARPTNTAAPVFAVLNQDVQIPSTNSVVDADLGLWSGGRIGRNRHRESAVSWRRMSAILASKNFANFIEQATSIEVGFPVSLTFESSQAAFA